MDHAAKVPDDYPSFIKDDISSIRNNYRGQIQNAPKSMAISKDGTVAPRN